MNLYIHDIFAHAGLQYAISGGFHSFSCEEDESLFSTVKSVIRDLTNQKDNVLETVLLRLATQTKAQLEYGPSKNQTASPITKAAQALPKRDVTIPPHLASGEDFNCLIETLQMMGFEDCWWSTTEGGSVKFFTCAVPDDCGIFFLLFFFLVFFLVCPFFSSFPFSIQGCLLVRHKRSLQGGH